MNGNMLDACYQNTLPYSSYDNPDAASTLTFVEYALVPDDAAPYPTLRNLNVALCDNPRNPHDFATELESQYSLIQSFHDCFVDSSVGSSPQSLPLWMPSVHAKAYAPDHIASSLSGDCRQLTAPPPHPVASLLPPVPSSPCCAPAPPPNTASLGDNTVPFPPSLSNPSGIPKLCDTGGTSTPHGHEVPVPLGSPPTRKLRRAVRRLDPYPISSASSSQSGDAPSPPPTSPHSSTSSSIGSLAAYAAYGLKVSQRRNKQVDPSATPAQGSQSGAGGKAIPEWMRTQKCPHCGADWSTKRRPDFMRHVASHTRDDPEFACAGVPIHLAAAYGLDPVDVMRLVEKGEALLYDGQLMVGGCKYPFSRADALKRHLCNPHISCIGTHTADWLIGNKKKLKRGE